MDGIARRRHKRAREVNEESRKEEQLMHRQIGQPIAVRKKKIKHMKVLARHTLEETFKSFNSNGALWAYSDCRYRAVHRPCACAILSGRNLLPL